MRSEEQTARPGSLLKQSHPASAASLSLISVHPSCRYPNTHPKTEFYPPIAFLECPTRRWPALDRGDSNSPDPLGAQHPYTEKTLKRQRPF